MTDTQDVPKPELAPVQIWRCRNGACKAWIRAELAASSTPQCPLCEGSMIRGIKHLPKLVNKLKAPKKKTDPAPWEQV